MCSPHQWRTGAFRDPLPVGRVILFLRCCAAAVVPDLARNIGSRIVRPVGFSAHEITPIALRSRHTRGISVGSHLTSPTSLRQSSRRSRSAPSPYPDILGTRTGAGHRRSDRPCCSRVRDMPRRHPTSGIQGIRRLAHSRCHLRFRREPMPRSVVPPMIESHGHAIEHRFCNHPRHPIAPQGV